MRELSLHILDLIENSIRAGASVIAIAIREKGEADLLEIVVEDDGHGLGVSPETAQDPFYTTKQGKAVGLGLSLFRSAAEQAGGGMKLQRSEMGGLAVTVAMRLSHLDRLPLGDLAATLSSIVCTNPQVVLRCRFERGDLSYAFVTPEPAAEPDQGRRRGLEVARQVREKVQFAISSLEISA